MNKLMGGVIASGVILLAGATSANNTNGQNHNLSNASTSSGPAVRIKPTCDGTSTTSNCVLDNVNYITYVYHPAVPEKSHTEQVTTYEKKVVSYCTLCNDGTYSPSCATGRGACSWHGGVAQWNAPVYRNVPVYSTKTIVDAPAQDAYYEKIVEK